MNTDSTKAWNPCSSVSICGLFFFLRGGPPRRVRDPVLLVRPLPQVDQPPPLAEERKISGPEGHVFFANRTLDHAITNGAMVMSEPVERTGAGSPPSSRVPTTS